MVQKVRDWTLWLLGEDSPYQAPVVKTLSSVAVLATGQNLTDRSAIDAYAVATELLLKLNAVIVPVGPVAVRFADAEEPFLDTTIVFVALFAFNAKPNAKFSRSTFVLVVSAIVESEAFLDVPKNVTPSTANPNGSVPPASRIVRAYVPGVACLNWVPRTRNVP
jgi:hypothetical protein